MKARPLWSVLAAALLGPAALAAPATAGASLEGSPLALPMVESAAPLALTTVATVAPGLEAAVPQAAPIVVVSSRRHDTIRYRPRRRVYVREREYDDRRRRSTGFSQLHAGFFSAEGDNVANDFVLGFRGGTNLDPVQMGLGLDWHHRADRVTVVLSEEPIPGGGTSERRRELARSSSNLFPIMAFFQLAPGGDLPIVPYFGAAGGYEILFISAEDFETGEGFDGTFGGWGWQLWAGAALPLSGRSRLAAEVFTNTADLERDVDDPLTGDTFHEVIDLEGIGMRFGINWGF